MLEMWRRWRTRRRRRRIKNPSEMLPRQNNIQYRHRFIKLSPDIDINIEDALSEADPVLHVDAPEDTTRIQPNSSSSILYTSNAFMAWHGAVQHSEFTALHSAVRHCT